VSIPGWIEVTCVGAKEDRLLSVPIAQIGAVLSADGSIGHARLDVGAHTYMLRQTREEVMALIAKMQAQEPESAAWAMKRLGLWRTAGVPRGAQEQAEWP
jgi:hypothetical protein